jgi:hypothetical protein
MKKVASFVLLTTLVAVFAISALVTEVQAKPVLNGDCTYACNRTTYVLTECCPYVVNDREFWRCKKIGFCYPE